MPRLRGSYSVGGGPTKHVGHGSMKRPTTTTTKPVAPRSSYQQPSVVKPSLGVGQSRPTPIVGTPKVPTTTTTARSAARKPQTLIKDIKKSKGAAKTRQSMLDEIMKGL